jgi:hypothetical protein
MAKIFAATLDIVPALASIEQGSLVFTRLFLEHPECKHVLEGFAGSFEQIS